MTSLTCDLAVLYSLRSGSWLAWASGICGITRATLGDRAFPEAAARTWNSLPLETRACSSLLTFQRDTTSHLFRQSYSWLGAVHSDHQQTSALSCATVLDINFVKCPSTVWWQHYNPDIFSHSISGSGTQAHLATLTCTDCMCWDRLVNTAVQTWAA